MSVEMLSRIIRPLILDQRFSFKLGKAEHESGMTVTSTWERHSRSQKETGVPFIGFAVGQRRVTRARGKSHNYV